MYGEICDMWSSRSTCRTIVLLEFVDVYYLGIHGHGSAAQAESRSET